MDEVVQIGLVLLNIFPASRQAGQPQRCSLLGHALGFQQAAAMLVGGPAEVGAMGAHARALST